MIIEIGDVQKEAHLYTLRGSLIIPLLPVAYKKRLALNASLSDRRPKTHARRSCCHRAWKHHQYYNYLLLRSPAKIETC